MSVKIASALLLIVLSSPSFADIGGKIEELNTAVKNVGGQPEECSSCYVASAGVSNGYGDNGSLMRSCVESICTKKEFSLAETLNKIYEGTTKANPIYDKEIQPLVSAISKEDANDKVTSTATI